MKYRCGTIVMLGDELMVEHGPKQTSLARIVAIGRNEAATNIDQRFYEWAKGEKIINETSVVVEWIEANPLENHDPNYAPVGNYMTLSSLDREDFVRRTDTT